MPSTEAKCRILPLWCQLLALQKPGGTRSCSLGAKAPPRAMSGACLCKSSSPVEHRTISSPPLVQGAMHSVFHKPREVRRKKTNNKQTNKQNLKPLTHPISLPLQPFYSSPPRGCAPQAEYLYFKEHVVPKHFMTQQTSLLNGS